MMRACRERGLGLRFHCSGRPCAAERAAPAAARSSHRYLTVQPSARQYPHLPRSVGWRGRPRGRSAEVRRPWSAQLLPDQDAHGRRRGPAHPLARGTTARDRNPAGLARISTPDSPWRTRTAPPSSQGLEAAAVSGMMTFTELASAPSHPPEPFTDRLRLAVAAYLAASRPPPASTPSPTSAATSPGASNGAWTHSQQDGRIWSCTSGGCRRSAGSSPLPSPGAFRSRPGSTGPASWTESWSTHPPSTSAVPQCPPSHPPWGSPTCSSRPCLPPPAS